MQSRMLTVLASLVLVAACAPQSADEKILATYNGGEVSESEYRMWLVVTKTEDEFERRQEVWTTLAAQESLAEAARQRSAEEKPAVRLALLNLETQLLENALRREVQSGIEIDEPEIVEWLAENGERLDRPRRVRLSNIFKRFAGGEPAELRSRMAEIRRQLADGADWAEMALRESDSQTRFRHGRIGLVKPGSLDPAVENVAFALSQDEISDVIETEDGLTLLRCDGVEEQIRTAAAQKRERAEQALRQKQGRLEWSELEAELLESVSLDLAAAQLVSTSDNAIVARSEEGWSLSLSELRHLLGFRGVARHPADLPQERAGKWIHAVAVQLQAAQHARSLGLDQDPDVRAKLHWRTTLTLAADELKKRVEERFNALGEDEIRAYFQQNKERFEVSETFRVAAISMRAQREELRQKWLLGQRLEADLRAGRLSFDEAAETYSELPSKSRGGLLGWLDRQQLAALGPHVFKAVKDLSPGDVGPLVQQPDALPSTGNSLWILELLDRRPARPMSFEEARHQAENALGNERTREHQKQLEEELLARLDVTPVGQN